MTKSPHHDKVRVFGFIVGPAPRSSLDSEYHTTLAHPGTYYLAFGDLPAILAKHVCGRRDQFGGPLRMRKPTVAEAPSASRSLGGALDDSAPPFFAKARGKCICTYMCGHNAPTTVGEER